MRSTFLALLCLVVASTSFAATGWLSTGGSGGGVPIGLQGEDPAPSAAPRGPALAESPRGAVAGSLLPAPKDAAGLQSDARPRERVLSLRALSELADPGPMVVRMIRVRETGVPGSPPTRTIERADFWWDGEFVRRESQELVVAATPSVAVLRESGGVTWVMRPTELRMGWAPASDRNVVIEPRQPLEWVRWAAARAREAHGADAPVPEASFRPASVWSGLELAPAMPEYRVRVWFEGPRGLPSRMSAVPPVGDLGEIEYAVDWGRNDDGTCLPLRVTSTARARQGHVVAAITTAYEWTDGASVDWREREHVMVDGPVVIDRRASDQRRYDVLLQGTERALPIDVTNPDAALDGLRRRHEHDRAPAERRTMPPIDASGGSGAPPDPVSAPTPTRRTPSVAVRSGPDLPEARAGSSRSRVWLALGIGLGVAAIACLVWAGRRSRA